MSIQDKLTTAHVNSVKSPMGQATTLPNIAYTDPEIYQKEVENIFLKSWIPVGRWDRVKNPGDFITLELVGEPVIIAKDESGKVRAFSNVCRHRASPVEYSKKGNTTSFTCPYHRWSFDLDGKLMGASFMESPAWAEYKDNCSLPEFRIEEWNGFLFLNFDSNAAPLAPQLTTLTEHVNCYRIGEMVEFPLEWAQDWKVPVNWKATLENFSEAYHHIGPHSTTAEPFLPAKLARYFDSGNDASCYFHMPTFNGQAVTEFSVPSYVPAEMANFYGVFNIHPLLNVLWAPGYIVPTWIYPVSETESRLSFSICVAPEMMERPDFKEQMQSVSDVLKSIISEDVDIFKGLDSAYTSRFFEPGRLSAAHELPINVMQRFVLRHLGL